jgi:hypothetical protein
MSGKSQVLVRDVTALLDRFDVRGVIVDPADADGWAVLRIADGDRAMPEMLASLDAACTALQVEGGYQLSFGWSHRAPENARRLPVPRWPNVVVKASSSTPLEGLVTDFCTRPALLNRHYWEHAG